ncbi:MAG: hypothetical protein WBV28_06085 [Terracidiphilus sp.]
MLASAGPSAVLIDFLKNARLYRATLALAVLRLGPAFLKQFLDLLPYAASKIRYLPFAWQLAAIKGEADLLRAQLRLKLLRESIAPQVEEIPQRELPPRQNAGLISMPDKTG